MRGIVLHSFCVQHEAQEDVATFTNYEHRDMFLPDSLVFWMLENIKRFSVLAAAAASI